MWRNDIKCKYMFMFTLKNLARKELRLTVFFISAKLLRIHHLSLLTSTNDNVLLVFKRDGKREICLYNVVQCALDISRSFSLKISRKTPHSSPMRVSYGVSFVNAKPGRSFTIVAVVLCVLSDYRVINGRDISKVYSIRKHNWSSLSLRSEVIYCGWLYD